MDSFEVNKVVGGFLLALLSTMVISLAGNALVHPQPLAKNAFPVEVNAVAGVPGGDTAPATIDPVAPLLAAASADAGKTVAQKQCATCHTFDKGAKNGVGPNLWGVLGGRKAHAEGFRYSAAMQAAAKDGGDAGKWDYEMVNTFLAKPGAYLKGTAMSYAGLRSAKDRADVLAFLRGRSDNPPPLP